jgi:hypothetical protein
MASDWPLLTGGRYSKVVVRTGLTVLTDKYYVFNTELQISVNNIPKKFYNTGT